MNRAPLERPFPHYPHPGDADPEACMRKAEERLHTHIAKCEMEKQPCPHKAAPWVSFADGGPEVTGIFCLQPGPPHPT